MNYFVAEKLISVENLSFNYEHKVILRDIGNERFPFEIYNIKKSELDEKHPYLGQTVAILGASGSGKSTFFKLLSGLNKPKSGKILIPKDDKSEELIEVEEGDVGFVQQKYPLSRNQSVKSMLIQAARQGKLESNKIESTVNNYLEEWGLENQKNLSSSQLSGG
jgi:ABC-type Fe3+/spermidine/putrescine transport system ATPase subunit